MTVATGSTAYESSFPSQVQVQRDAAPCASQGVHIALQVIVKRGEKVDGPPGPIVVATRNNDLQAVVDATLEDRREGGQDLSNQVFEPYLKYYRNPA